MLTLFRFLTYQFKTTAYDSVTVISKGSLDMVSAYTLYTTGLQVFGKSDFGLNFGWLPGVWTSACLVVGKPHNKIYINGVSFAQEKVYLILVINRQVHLECGEVPRVH